jgi:hypothetical protein
MDKRKRFVTELRAEAEARGLVFKVDYKRGKGGHAVVRVGSKWTTLPSRDPDPVLMARVRRA